MHILDKVENIYIKTCKPIHHNEILFNNSVVIKIFVCDRSKVGTDLILCFFVYTAVNSIKEAFCEVCTSAEELHFLTCLSCRYAAAD